MKMRAVLKENVSFRKAESDTVYYFQMKSTSKDVHYNNKQTSYEVTLVNADVAGISVGSPNTTVLRERTPDKYATMKIKLRTIPTILLGTMGGEVEIIATSGNPDRLGVSSSPNKNSADQSARLHFTPSDWDKEQTLYVFPIDNTVKDLDATVDVSIKSYSKHYKEYKDLTGKTTSFTVKDDDIPTIIMNMTCKGLATCNRNDTTGQCTVSVDNKRPQNNEDVLVTCSSKKVTFDKSSFKLTPGNNYTHTMERITSANCGNTFEASNTGTVSINCTGEATNYYGTGMNYIDYLYNF